MIKKRSVKETGIGTVVIVKEECIQLRDMKKISTKTRLFDKYFIITNKYSEDYFEALPLGIDNEYGFSGIIYNIRSRERNILHKNILSRCGVLNLALKNISNSENESSFNGIKELLTEHDIHWEGK